MKVRPYGAHSFFMYSKLCLSRAIAGCIGGRLRPLLCMDGPAASIAQESGIREMKIVQKMMEKIAHPFAGCFLLVLQFAPLCAYGKRTSGVTGFSVDNIYYGYKSETEVIAQLWPGREYNSTITIPSTVVDKYVEYTGWETITETYEVIGVSLHNNTDINSTSISLHSNTHINHSTLSLHNNTHLQLHTAYIRLAKCLT